jgi:hypothetical protein
MKLGYPFRNYQLTRVLDRSMGDEDGPRIAKSLYHDIFKSDSEYINPDDIAYALDAAVRSLQQETNDPMRWAPYIHLGI